MRNEVYVRVTQDEAKQLRNLLSLSYNMAITAAKAEYAAVRDLERRIVLDFLAETDEEVEELLDAATRYHDAEGDSDIELDSNAAISEADGGTWVQAWLWLPADNEQEG